MFFLKITFVEICVVCCVSYLIRQLFHRYRTIVSCGSEILKPVKFLKFDRLFFRFVKPPFMIASFGAFTVWARLIAPND